MGKIHPHPDGAPARAPATEEELGCVHKRILGTSSATGAPCEVRRPNTLRPSKMDRTLSSSPPRRGPERPKLCSRRPRSTGDTVTSPDSEPAQESFQTNKQTKEPPGGTYGRTGQNTRTDERQHTSRGARVHRRKDKSKERPNLKVHLGRASHLSHP